MSVQSIDRVLDIVELLSREQRPMSVTEIGKRVNLHKSTAFRLVSALRERGYVERDGNGSDYRIGPAFIEIASRYLNQVELTTEAAPFLAQLSKRVNQTTFLATITDGNLVYLDKVEHFTSIRRYSIIGRRKPLHSTSLGKAMLMGRSLGEIRELVGPEPFERFTTNTLTSLDDLVDQLRDAAVRGWTTDDEEDEPGTRCVGAPIRDYRGHIVAAISASFPVTDRSPAVTDVGPEVVAAAQRISERLGFRESRASDMHTDALSINASA